MKAIVYSCADYAAQEDAWEVSIDLANGKRLILNCGLKDMENLHSVVRAALQLVSIKRLETAE